MAKDNWGRSLSAVLANEGDYSSDPRDPGNWTGGKRGAGVLEIRRPQSPIAVLTPDTPVFAAGP